MEKHKKIDTKAIEYHIAGILKALGDNPEREGLIDTPKRVAKMYEEVFEGMNYTNEEIADMFNKTFALDRLEEEFENVECKSQNGNSDMVVVKDIDIFSYCEHHLALMYDMKVTVAYIPKGRVIGLSKIARIADMVSKRLQLQERIGSDIADIMQMVTGAEDIAVLIEGCHSCMTARGIKKTNTKTYTQTLRGRFNNESNGFVHGGIDSTTCLGMAVEKYGPENVIALSIAYGQKHTKEIEASDKIVKYYNVEHIYLDLAKIFQYSDCSLLSHSDKEIPKESYNDQIKSTNGSPVSTYVPFRNGLFLSSAASIALSKGCSEIYYGAHADDAAGSAYPDCSSDFNNAINEAIYLGSGKQIKVVAPFINATKDQVVKKGLEINVPYKYTWSCYEGGEKPCGKCGTCIDRAKAFELNGIKDPAME